MSTQTALKRTAGGDFLTAESLAENVFTPEDFSEETRMIRQAMQEFMEQEIDPIWAKVGSKEFHPQGLELLDKAAKLGFLGIAVPEAYGGSGMDFLTEIAVGEKMFAGASFAMTIGVQTSIGMAPILLYGTEAQKQKYLPGIVDGSIKTCYCLTEPGAGSDANSGKTRAIRSEDGSHFVLNGQKMWITNSGFADVFIVFAKVDEDDVLSAFIVEKSFGGITLGEEESKMGLHGSSTRQVFFNDVRVPAENLLGDQRGGFKIALNVLSTGRIKLGVACLGGGKKALELATQYALERKQFGAAIANFGAIQHKLAEMAARSYGMESAVFRTAHQIDLTRLEMIAAGKDPNVAKAKCVEEYAMECAMIKVFSSEALDFIVDEGVQIHGGMGFSAETRIEGMYRDARINRIYEGTNEINRMLSVDYLLKKAMAGKTALFQKAAEVTASLMNPAAESIDESQPFAIEKQILARMKKAIMLTGGAAVNKLTTGLKDEQEILMQLADMLMQTYVFESALLRTEKLFSQGKGKTVHKDMLYILMLEAIEIIDRAGRESIYAFAEGDEQRMLLLGIKRFTKRPAMNFKEIRRQIARAVIEAGGYPV